MIFSNHFVSLLGVSFMNRGLLGTKSGDKGEKKQKWSNLCDFYFFIVRHFHIGWGFHTHGNGRRGQITQAICQKEQKL